MQLVEKKEMFATELPDKTDDDVELKVIEILARFDVNVDYYMGDGYAHSIYYTFIAGVDILKARVRRCQESSRGRDWR